MLYEQFMNCRFAATATRPRTCARADFSFSAGASDNRGLHISVSYLSAVANDHDFYSSNVPL